MNESIADLRNPARAELLAELERRYLPLMEGEGRKKARRRYWWKKNAWRWVTGITWVIKRTLDFTGALVGLIVLSPLFLAVALSIKLTDKGPILFFQTRVGKWGEEFPFPKFRSMVTNAEELKKELMAQSDHGEESVTFKMKKDPRITWIGRIIRKLSIDELPQLWCVLNGKMSLVGPRPPTVAEVAQYSLRDRRRLDVIPGLTCIWQVSGRNRIDFDRWMEMDLQYIDSFSIWLDFKILFRTIFVVLTGYGAE